MGLCSYDERDAGSVYLIRSVDAQGWSLILPLATGQMGVASNLFKLANLRCRGLLAELKNSVGTSSGRCQLLEICPRSSRQPVSHYLMNGPEAESVASEIRTTWESSVFSGRSST